MRTRVLAAALVVVALLLPATVFAGGGSEGAASAGKPMAITWLARGSVNPLWVEGKDTWFIEQIESKFNVDIKLNGIDPNDGEKVTVMLAAGEFPDLGNPWGDTYKHFDDGVSRGISEDMIRKYAPNYARIMEKEYPIGWLMYRNKQNPKEFISIQGIATNTDCNLWFLGFRVDWAEKVGMPVPNYKQKKVSGDRFGKIYFLDETVTVDWVEKLITAFRDKDPDGNGKNDTIPWGANKYFGWTWNAITGAYGFAEGYNVFEGEKLYDWAVYPGYKDFLKLAAKWYKAGLVDKEFVNLDLTPAWQKLENQLIGAGTVQISYLDQEYALKRPPNTLVPDADAKKGAEGVVMVPPVGPTGKQGARAYGTNPVGYPFLINKKVDDTKCATILAILDWMRYDGDESFVWALNGKPGVHFDWQGEPWNSAPIARKADQVPADVTKAGNFPNSYPPGYTREKNKFVVTSKLLNLYNTWMFAPRGQALSIRPYRLDVFNETKYGTLNTKYGATLSTIVNEFQLKAITGVLDVDSEWDAYVANWNKNGGAELMAEMAKAPILSELRAGKKVY